VVFSGRMGWGYCGICWVLEDMNRLCAFLGIRMQTQEKYLRFFRRAGQSRCLDKGSGELCVFRMTHALGVPGGSDLAVVKACGV